MKPNLSLKVLTTLFSLFIIWGACTKHPDCGGQIEEYHRLYEHDTRIIPYKGYEKLTFTRNGTNDTFTFSGTGQTIFYAKTTGGTDDCPNDVYWEGHTINFTSSAYPSPIQLNLYNKIGGYGVYLNVIFKRQILENGASTLGNPLPSSIILNGKTYKDFVCLPIDVDRNDTSSYALFNKIEGIIKIKIQNGDELNLVKME